MPDTSVSVPTRRRLFSRAHLALVGILLVAAVLRFAGTRFGFPLLVHPDEWAVVGGVLEMAKNNSFEPPWHLRPDHLEMKVDYIAFAVYAIFRGIPVEVGLAADPLPFYWIARMVTALSGVVMVLFAYLIGARLSRRLGLIAATLVALLPAFVRDAHYVTPDVPLACMALALVYALMRYWDDSRMRVLLWSSLAVALAVTIKYPGAVGVVVIALVVIATAVRDRDWRRIITHGSVSAAAVVGFVFLISPVLFTDLSGVRAELGVQAAGNRLGHPDLGFWGAMEFYARTFVQQSGVLIVALFVLGVVVAVRRRWFVCLPWTIGLAYWAALSVFPMVWVRWGLPMWITPVLFAAAGIDFLWSQRGLVWRIVAVAVTAVVVGHLAIASTAVTAQLMAGDTRVEALDYAEAHGISKANTRYEGYTAFSPGTPKLFFDKFVRTDGSGYEFLTDDGDRATYVMLSSGMYGRVIGNEAMADEERIYQWIFDNATEVARFEPMSAVAPSIWEPVSMVRNGRAVIDTARGGLSGPVVRIFELPPVTPDN